MIKPSVRPIQTTQNRTKAGRLGHVAPVVWPILGLILALTQTQQIAAGDLVQLSEQQRRAFGIELTTPTPAGATLTRRYPAQVTVPNRQLRVVSAPQAGVIESLLVAEGERVEAGQVLARLSSPDLVEAQGGYLEAVTRLELADSELARDRKLHSDGIIAERRLIETEARRRELSTMAEQRRQRLELAGLSTEDVATLAKSMRMSSSLPVRTPIGGVVLEQMASTGQSVAAAAPLYRVAELAPLWVEAHVPVDGLGGIGTGGRVLLPALDIDGEIVTVGRMVHSEDQGVLVRAEVREGTDRLRPGQFVEVQLAATAASNQGSGWRIPSDALVRNAGKTFCFASRAGGFAAVAVQVLAQEEKSAVVTGISAGDRIATSGLAALKAAWLAGDGSAGGE